MPSQANITVKKYDGTTDVIYNAINPAGGDGQVAMWRNQTVGSAPAHYPTLEVKSKWNGQKTARRTDWIYVYPQIATDSTTGLVTVVNKAIWILSAVVPMGMPLADTNEAAAQFGNIMADASVKTICRSGFAPT